MPTYGQNKNANQNQKASRPPQAWTPPNPTYFKPAQPALLLSR